MMQSGYEGLVLAQQYLRLPGMSIDKVAFCMELQGAALRELAKSGAAMEIAHGGQSNAMAAQVHRRASRQSFFVLGRPLVTDRLWPGLTAERPPISGGRSNRR
jgi:hypothetical protein